MIRRKASVSVPCSTSNLGPAFDSLGLALSLRNELTLEFFDGPEETVVEIEGEGKDALSRGADNLTARAAASVLAGKLSGRLVLKSVNRIPLSRGLGSSAAAVLAGLCAANQLIGRPLDDQQLLEYAVVMEGHPDNAAAAMLGGLVATLRKNGKTQTYPFKPHKDLRAVVCVPDMELSTSKARSVLPPTVLREQAVANIGRSTLLAAALEAGRWQWLAEAMEDQLHQPYRAPLIKGFSDVLKAARRAGPCGAALSGAGPSVLALAPASSPLQAIGEAMTQAFASHGVSSRYFSLSVENQGARILA
jgi:homoserine kinase